MSTVPSLCLSVCLFPPHLSRFCSLSLSLSWLVVHRLQWTSLAAHGFYKFRNSSYAIILYEPSDQVVLEAYSDIYISSGISHTPGFRFAYNGDPAMFATYTASRTGRATHTSLGRPASPAAAVLSCVFRETAAGALMLTLSHSQADKWWAYLVNVSGLPGASVTVIASDVFQVPSGLADLHSLSLITDTSPPNILLADSRGTVAVCEVALATLHCGHTVVLPAWPVAPNSSAVAALMAGNQTLLVQAVAGPPVQILANCTLGLQLWTASLQGTSLDATALGPVACLHYQDPACNVGVAAALSLDPGCMGMHVVVTYSLCNVPARVFVSMVCSSTNGLAVTITPAPHQPAVAFGVGSDLRAALRGGLVLLAHANAFCWNSFTRDDDLPPHYLGNMVCDSFTEGYVREPRDPSTLAYTVGPVPVLQARLATAAPGRLVTSACDAELLHGTYDLGWHPTPLLLDGGVAVSVHRGLLRNASSTDCGAPRANEARVVVDAWMLPLTAFSMTDGTV